MSEYEHFSDRELQCSCCGKLNPHKRFKELMLDVVDLRKWYGKPMRVTSAYRCSQHPIEVKKLGIGEHTRGAIDLQVPVEDCYKIVKKAFSMGCFSGIGINLKGDPSKRFIHLDNRSENPRIWSY